MRVFGRIATVCIFACIAAACSRDEESARRNVAPTQPLVVYSSLPEEVVKAITAAYTAQSSMPINYMLDSERTLIDKLVRKAHRPGADLLLIPDAGHLTFAVEADVLRPVISAQLQQSVPANLRDPDHYWFGLSTNAVSIVYDDRAVDPAKLSGYAALGEKIWAGRLCLLSSAATSSRSLVAFLIAELGERNAEAVVRRWRKNLAAPVFSTGRDLLRAIEDGICKVAFVSSADIAEKVLEGTVHHVGIHWPRAKEGGTQLTLLGAGVTRHANNPENALEFLEWLAAEPGQRILARSARGFPANVAVKPARPLDRWVGFDLSPIDAAALGYLHQEASLLIERSGYR